MATVKLKFRSSTVPEKEGNLFFQIIHHRQTRQLSTGLRVSESEWNHEEGSLVVPEEASTDRRKYLTELKENLKERQTELLRIISEMETKGVFFTARDVVDAYKLHKPTELEGVVPFTQALIEELTRIGKRAAVRRYKASLSSLFRYNGGEEVEWKHLSSTFILGYEEFLMRRGLCRNSTSFYMRNLRAIVNRAAEKGVYVPGNLFDHVYMGVDKTVKRAVSLDVIRMIRDVDLSRHPALDFARRVFMFAFYTRGMSFVDIAYLKKSDVRNGFITYSRRKTRQLLTVRIEPETWNIIDSFGESGTSFLLPIITDERGDTDHQYMNAYFRINRNLRKVGAMLGLEHRLTLYVARHAWASIAHSNNVALSVISKAMGHDSEKTTAIYLQSLDTASVDKANSDIIRMIGCAKMT